jgi:uncharacterized repeat protein (TIGR03806 family)
MCPVLSRFTLSSLLVLLSLIFILACSKDDKSEEPCPAPALSPVNMNLDELPHATLSDYNFFQGNMADLNPELGVLPYELISKLFTDYAEKKRFIWMPEDVSGSYVDDHDLISLPTGAVLIKNFYYTNVLPSMSQRIVETRLIYNTGNGWAFAEYVWNDEQTEAYLDMDGSYTPISWVDENSIQHDIQYRIPSEVECLVCHKKNSLPIPIGVKPQNLNEDLEYADGTSNQLAKWASMGYLQSGYPADINTVVKWDDPSQDITLRVRSYIDINCAHCHAEGSHCDYRPMRFAFSETSDPVNLGVCVPPDEVIQPELTHIVASGTPNRSVLYYRLNATAENERMPLLGRTIVHEEAVALIQEWIIGLSPPCN